jgi:hypothetical protein
MSEPNETQAGGDAADKVAAPSTEHDSPPASQAEGGGDIPDGEEKPEGAEAKPPKPTVDKLTAWSEKLSRRKGRLDAREGRVVDRERATEERERLAAEKEAKAAEVLTLLETDPDKLLDQIAKVKGVTKPAVYKSWMEKHLQENDPNERVTRLEQQIAEDKAARAEAQKQAAANAETNTINAYLRDTRPYVEKVLPEFEHLSAYAAENVWERATSFAISEWKRTGKEPPLDKVLQDMENATAAEYRRIEAARASRLRGSDAQDPANSERAGADPSAKPETRKRSISNAHAATKAAPDSEEDVLKLSDKELTRRAVEALRRADPRWR